MSAGGNAGRRHSTLLRHSVATPVTRSRNPPIRADLLWNQHETARYARCCASTWRIPVKHPVCLAAACLLAAVLTIRVIGAATPLSAAAQTAPQAQAPSPAGTKVQVQSAP